MSLESPTLSRTFTLSPANNALCSALACATEARHAAARLWSRRLNDVAHPLERRVPNPVRSPRRAASRSITPRGPEIQNARARTVDNFSDKYEIGKVVTERG